MGTGSASGSNATFGSTKPRKSSRTSFSTVFHKFQLRTSKRPGTFSTPSVAISESVVRLESQTFLFLLLFSLQKSDFYEKFPKKGQSHVNNIAENINS